MMAGTLKIWLILLGPIFGWIFTRVDCVSQTGSQGNYGQPCKNQTCNGPLKCLIDTCWCDVNYNWDSGKKICRKLCLGSDAGLVRTGSFKEHYEMYKQRYTNCTYVEGNLELTFLEGDYDLKFLQSIEEVTGYVLIVSVWSNYVPLKNLRIIRGRTLYNYQNADYALYVALNYNPNNNSQGIFELGFKSLTEITKGKVYFHNNNALCYENSIRWQDINPREPNEKVIFKSDTPYGRRSCGECHSACYNKVTNDTHCWGQGPDMCQKLNYGDVCSLSCEGRCFGSEQNQCCHPECAAGCHGPRKSECFACKTFYNDGMCETNCPAESIYDNGKLTWIKNPNAKYAYGSLCVKVCPEHLLQDQGACVVKCPDRKEPDVNNTACVECSGTCKKTCGGAVNMDFVHQKNIETFKDCTSIHGNLRILKTSFDGDPFRNITGINASDLEVFKDVTEITGFLAIQQIPSSQKDLSFLSSLQTIQGRELSGQYSFNLASMNITELGLKSLQHIRNGNALIFNTPHLCYLENINFTGIFSTPKQKLLKYQTKDANTCRAEGKVCDPECSQDGCWGPGPFNCLKCAHKRVSENGQCVHFCSDLTLLYENENGDVCEKCHAQCAGSCTGPGPSNCTRCKQVRFPGNDSVSGVCMETCPVLQTSPMYYYPDERNICQPCNDTCAEGCTGPSSEVRNGGCNTCELAFNQTLVDGTISCLPPEPEDCPKGYYLTRLRPLPDSPLSRKNICQPCHTLCLDCNGPDIGTCTECRFFNYFSLCVSGCPNYTYPVNETKSCQQCDNECVEGCTGPTRKDCRECKNYKIIHTSENETFECVKKCPPNLQYLVDNNDPEKRSQIVCADETHPQVIARMSADQEILITNETSWKTSVPYLMYRGPNLPVIPDNVKAVQVGNSDVLVTWEMHESHRNQNLTYRVFYAPVQYRDKGKFFDVTGSTTTIIGSLSQDETYTIQVSSVSFHRHGPMSHPVMVTIQHFGEYLLPLDVRQIGAKNVLIQWDKLNLTDIELESVKRLVLNHMMSASTNIETHDLPDGKTRTHYLLQEVDVNRKHIFQLVVFFELQSKSPVVSKPAEFELVPRALGESMLHLTEDMDIYEILDESYRADAHQCTRMSRGENFISTRQYEKIVTEKIKCHVKDDGKYKGVMNATGIWFYKNNRSYRKLAVIDNKTLTWIIAHL